MMRYGIFSMRWASASRGSVSGRGDSCKISCGKSRHTDKRRWKPYLVTIVGVDNYSTAWQYVIDRGLVLRWVWSSISDSISQTHWRHLVTANTTAWEAAAHDWRESSLVKGRRRMPGSLLTKMAKSLFTARYIYCSDACLASSDSRPVRL